MPRQIVSTERDQASRKAQMELLIGEPSVWLRIDKGDGSIMPVNGVAVTRAAHGSFKRPNHAIATGRFQTPFAIYCTADKLTDEERQAATA